MATIYQRGKSWYIHYRVDGRRVRKKVGTSKKVAELALADITVKLEKKEIGFEDTARRKTTLITDFLKDYSEYSRTNHRPNTTKRYQAIINNFKTFLLLHPEVKSLSQLSPKLIEKYKTYKRDVETTANGADNGSKRKGAKSNTINMEIKTLRTIFGLAVKWGDLKKNPVAGVTELKVEDAKPVRFLTTSEVKKLLEAADGEMCDILTTFIYSGMRKSELIHLTWDDIDFGRDKILIRYKDWWKPKTGQREISMHQKLKSLFLRLYEKNKKRSIFVFPHKDG
ncbi:MAG: tyrosine-type recombinase/integrase, partial [Planctomycetota bacterium]